MTFPSQVRAGVATDADMKLIKKYAEEYCALFGANVWEVLDAPFTVVRPDSSNPYKQMYVAN